MKKIEIEVCMGSSCFSRGNNKTVEIIEKFIEENKDRLPVKIELRGSLCKGECVNGPVITINGKRYFGVTPDTVLDLIRFYVGEKEYAE